MSERTDSAHSWPRFRIAWLRLLDRVKPRPGVGGRKSPRVETATPAEWERMQEIIDRRYPIGPTMNEVELMSERTDSSQNREPIEVVIVKGWIAKALPSDAEGDWHAKFSPAAMTLVDAILTSDAGVLEALTDPVRDVIAALELGDDTEQVQRQIGYLCGLMAVMRWWSQRADGRDALADKQLVQARTFLASVASASAQGTMEQSEWMIAQAREGLRRAGGTTSMADQPSSLSDAERGRLMLAVYYAVLNAVKAGLDEHDARNEAETAIQEGVRRRG